MTIAHTDNLTDVPLLSLMIKRELVGVKELLFPELYPKPFKPLSEEDKKLLELIQSFYKADETEQLNIVELIREQSVNGKETF